MHQLFLVAGCSLLAFIVDDVSQAFVAGEVNFSFMTEMGKLCLWVTLFVAICYISSPCSKQSQCIFQASRTERRQASNCKELDLGRHSQHAKMLASNNEHGEGSGTSKAIMRSIGRATCHKQLLSPQVHAKGVQKLAHKKESIRLAVQAGDHQKAESLLQEIVYAGFLPDVHDCNFVINGYAKKGEVACAETCFMKMCNMGVTPNRTSYNMIMDACVKADNVEAAKRWFGRMMDDGHTPDEVSYANMIHAYAKHGATKQAEAWHQQMVNAGVEPNIVIYNSLIVAHSRSGDLAGAEKWAYAAETIDVAARAANHTVVVDACAKCDESPVEKQVEKMNSSKTESNVITYSSMIDAYAKVGDRDGAERWHRRMLERGLQPNGHTFSSVITACAKACDPSAASQYLTMMEKAGIQPDVVVYGSVLNACAKAGDTERAKRVFQHMQSSGIQPNGFAYSLMAQTLAYRGEWVEVEKLEEMMSRTGYSKTEHFLSAQLLSYARASPRQPQRAEEAFMAARAKGILVNKHVLAAFRRAVGATRCKQLTSAEDTWPKRAPHIQQHQQSPAADARRGSTVKRGSGIHSPTASGIATAYIKAGAH